MQGRERLRLRTPRRPPSNVPLNYDQGLKKDVVGLIEEERRDEFQRIKQIIQGGDIMKRRLMIQAECAAVLFFVLLTFSVLGWDRPAAQAAVAGKGLEKTKITYIGLASMSMLPGEVAQEKGYFKEEGFTEVKFFNVQGAQAGAQAMVSGVGDVTVASPTTLIQLLETGYKMKAVWGGFNLPFLDWYAQPRFKSILETKGGRFAITQYGSLTDVLTRMALLKAGIDPEKDVKILQIGPSPQALAAMEARQIDVALMSAPTTYVAAEKGFVKLMSMKDQIAPDWPLHMIFFKDEYIAQNPNTIKAFLRAHSRAMSWIKENPDEAAKLASSVYKFKLEFCRKFIDQFKDYWYADGRLASPEGLKAFWETEVMVGDVKEPMPMNRWLDDTFLKTQNEWLKLK